jgi:predicted transcriptional regulator
MTNTINCVRDKNNDVLVKKAKKDLSKNALLGSEVRFRIVYLLLNNKELCVCDFCDILEMNQSPISQHLRKLKDAGILENKREKLAIFYFIPYSMREILQLLINSKAKE